MTALLSPTAPPRGSASWRRTRLHFLWALDFNTHRRDSKSRPGRQTKLTTLWTGLRITVGNWKCDLRPSRETHQRFLSPLKPGHQHSALVTSFRSVKSHRSSTKTATSLSSQKRSHKPSKLWRTPLSTATQSSMLSPDENALLTGWPRGRFSPPSSASVPRACIYQVCRKQAEGELQRPRDKGPGMCNWTTAMSGCQLRGSFSFFF